MSKAAAAINAVAHGHNPRKAIHALTIPPNDADHRRDASVHTPKTPADEAIEYFESAVSDGEHRVNVYELALDDDGGPNKDRSYIRLPPPYKPYILRVSIEAGSPASKNGVFKTNFPLDGGVFDRDRFVERILPSDFSKPIKVDLPISHAGAFVYWVEYDNDHKRVKGREGYFNIDPILRVKGRESILSSNGSPTPLASSPTLTNELVNLPLDGLVILTAVSKWMGPIDSWRPFLQETKERGYNMIHYTPLQQRGESNSPYSISEQLAYDRTLFGPDVKDTEGGVKRVEEFLKMAKDEYGLLSLTDVVLNHTANNSDWLQDHPEAGFSPFNTPHLAPAVEIDDAMIDFSANLASRGLPTNIQSSEDLDKVMEAFKETFKSLNLWQYYVLDVDRERRAVQEALNSEVPAWEGPDLAGKDVAFIAETIRNRKLVAGLGGFAKRFGVYVDPKIAASAIRAAFRELNDKEALAAAWGKVADVLNVDLYEEANGDQLAALDGIKNRVSYARLDSNGPKLGEITKEVPLVESYFTRLPHNDRTKKHDPTALSVANNGWIWDADPLQNFALPPSKAYLRREVIVWGDCVKLRYGDGPASNPWLWEHMTNYVKMLAIQFDGFRIDNCHSTPLHVGITLLDAARVVNPDLYVCAELFTGNEDTDTHFVSRLGINSLIRESYNAWDPKEYSRILYRHGLNKPIGSMDAACLSSPDELPPPTGKGPTRPCVVQPLQGSIPHALLYDLTHDNESPLHKRSAEDALSTGALATFSFCAIGSVKGFDDIHPKLLNLVAESRHYELPGTDAGIGRAKRILNHLHTEMMLGGFSEGHVHQENDYIVIHRVHPSTTKGYVLVAHTAFSKGSKDRGWINPIKLVRTKAKFIFGCSIEVTSYETPSDPELIRGLPTKLSDIAPVVPNTGFDNGVSFSEISVPDFFPPGSIMVFETQMEGVSSELDTFLRDGLDDAVAGLELLDLNVVLYRADAEERDVTKGEIGAYNVPGLGNLVYCGLEGWMHPLRHIMKFNDLGHPLAAHIREGTWALDYIASRLIKHEGTSPNVHRLGSWLKSRFERIKNDVPAFMRPKYFAIVVYEAYKASRRAAIEQFSEFVSQGDSFTQDLALCSLQVYGQLPSASLDPGKSVPCLAAGLPHFATSWARTWGRDVFISLRGLFLTTGNFIAAKQHILAFCSTLKHGLIPNLLDSVRTPRYNSRDSPWWMLQNIQDYTTMAPDGLSILKEPVKRRFPKDDTFIPWDDARAYSYSSSVAEVIQEILQRHADGISFREHNAGPNLDMQMSDGGFNIDIHVDWKTGIVYGGSAQNCGTWMDKMGESEKAGTKGVPGTPRDGAPVEIIGLLKSTLRWLDQLSARKQFPFQGVEATIDGSRRLVTYKEWSDLLQASFEKNFYIPSDPSDDSKYNVKSALVNRRGIYKDVLGSGAGREWSDYQCRCNYPIAMIVAPELFDPTHALEALENADKYLRSPMGMKTLEANDGQYRPYYDNANDSSDPAVAKGRNYHQGPEWGWPLGYFLRAYLHFGLLQAKGEKERTDTVHHLINALLRCRSHIRTDQWRGLPELTNKDAEHCRDSCPTQAWSASTLLDFLDDVRKVGK